MIQKETKILSRCLVLIFLASSCQGHGDITLAGLFPINAPPSTQSKFNCSNHVMLYGFLSYQAMRYAIDKVNDDEDILPNITLRGIYFNTCANPSITARHTRDVIKIKIQKDGGIPLVGVVGAAVSDVSAKVANILQVFQIPQISYASTSVVLSNKDDYSYFLRTVAPDSFQVQALVDICLEFHWTYVMTVNSEGMYGTKGIEGFIKVAQDNHICTDHIATVKPYSDEAEYDRIVATMVERGRGTGATAVLLFCGGGHGNNIVRAAQRNKDAGKFTWIGSDAWDTSVTDYDDVDILSIGLLRPKTSQEFIDYVQALDVRKPQWQNDRYLRDFWQQVFQCSLANGTSSSVRKCAGNESFKDAPFQITEIHSVINAVNAFAQSLDIHQKELCPNMKGICSEMDTNFGGDHFMEHLMETTFRDSMNNTMSFNKNGEVEPDYAIMKFRSAKNDYIQIGTWKPQKGEGSKSLRLNYKSIRWTNKSAGAQPPQSYCSAVCPFGSVQQSRAGYNATCCWMCHACTRSQIIGRNETCVDVPVGYVSTTNRTAWKKRELVYLRWHEKAPTFLLTVSGLGIVLTLLTCAVFIVYCHNPTVKASGREASFIILAGILLSFINPFLYIARPTDPLCYARKLCVGMALAMIYSSVFMKLNRVYRIFQSAKASARRPALVRPKSQVLITLGLICIQLLFVSLWLVIAPTHAVEEYYAEKEQLHLECNMKAMHFVGSQIYVIVLMILCTVYAFKTRKFPKNFNESKYIGITLYTVCVISTLFLAFFLNAKDKFTENLLIAGASIIWGYISLVGLFAQRLYVLFFMKRDVCENSTNLTNGLRGESGETSPPMTRTRELTHVTLKRSTKVCDTPNESVTKIRKGFKKRSVTF